VHEDASLPDELEPLLGAESIGVSVVGGGIELTLECHAQLLDEGSEGGGKQLREELVHGKQNSRL